jgi:hypothetical protein
MLDREVVREFLNDKLEASGIEVPEDIHGDVLVETFCKYVEDDYYEWLKDNFKSFFEHGDPDWDRIKDKARRVEQN